MKQIKYLLFILLIIPINVLGISLNCPNKVESNSNFTCTIYHDSNSLYELSANISLPNQIKLKSVEVDSGYQKNINGHSLTFKYEKNGGYNAPTKIAVLYFNVSNLEAKTNLTIKLENIIYKYLETDTSYTNDTEKLKSITVLAGETTTTTKNITDPTTTENVKYTLILDNDNETKEVTCNKGSLDCNINLNTINIPEKPDYDFIGWAEDKTCQSIVNNNYIINKDSKLYACYNKNEVINYLESLVIDKYAVNFDKDVFEYQITTINETSLNIVATPVNNEAKVTISNSNLELGNNVIDIIVSLNNQDTTYKLVVNNITNVKETPKLSTLKIIEYKIDFNQDYYDYDVVIDYNINKLNIIATSNNEDNNVTIYGNENLIDGSVIEIEVASNDGSEKTTYRLNIKKKTFIETYFYYFYGGCLLVFCIIVYFVVKIIKKRKLKNKSKNKK